MADTSTQLRYVFSVDPLVLTTWVNAIPYKIEVKNIVVKSNKFFLFYIIADKSINEVLGEDLDD